MNSVSETLCLGEEYTRQLIESVIPFWMSHSIDTEHCGFLTCLDRTGKVFDTEKYTWLQARQVWMLSALHHRLEPMERNDAWITAAKSGVDFLLDHARNNNGDWYYALDQTGKPLMQPFSIFSDAFVAMALSEYARATSDERCKELAATTYNRFVLKLANPKGIYSKIVPGSRPLKSLSLRMIHLNLLIELDWMLEKQTCLDRLEECVSEVLSSFVAEDAQVLYENAPLDGRFMDCAEGRMINPGHGLETLWMVIAAARILGNQQYIATATALVLSTIEYGWDREFDGIFYRQDIKSKPLYQIEWDQKMWWGHAEAMIALAMSYTHTHDPRFLSWMTRLDEYISKHYRDDEHGEWFGYLNRQGQRILDIKGGRWKGCYHVPRALLFVAEESKAW